MAVEAIGAGASVAPNAFGALKAEDFVKIIFTELANQDPLQPNDSQALLEQLSTIRSIQSDMDLGTRVGSLVAQNEMAAASNLIGRTVKGRSQSGSTVSGVVRSVTRSADGPVLNLAEGPKVRMSAVDEVLAAPAPPAAPATTGGTP